MLLQLQVIACLEGIEVKRAEDRWAAYTQTPELLAGSSLLHTEWTPGNILAADPRSVLRSVCNGEYLLHGARQGGT